MMNLWFLGLVRQNVSQYLPHYQSRKKRRQMMLLGGMMTLMIQNRRTVYGK